MPLSAWLVSCWRVFRLIQDKKLKFIFQIASLNPPNSFQGTAVNKVSGTQRVRVDGTLFLSAI